MRVTGLLSTLAAASLMAAPVVAQASTAQVQRGNRVVEQGNDVRGFSFVLVAVVIAAILAVALGGKSDNPVSP